jgi:pimeloyl-ACP methyl ester carboxylesterase
MFETSGNKNFVNRAHVGEHAKIEFEIYINEHGEEKIEGVESSIHYIKSGMGDPLILVHGVGQSLYTFRNMIEELGKHFTVYAIDLPAHGYSDRPSISYNVEEVALCIEAFMNSVGLASAHFCTFGESATYVLDFVQHNQERAGSLMFISPLMSSTGGRRSPVFPFVSLGSRLLLSRQSFYNDLLYLYFDRTILTPEVLEETFMPFCDKEFRQIIKLYSANYNDREIAERMLEIQHHVLVIRGADDKVSPPLQEGIAGFPVRDLKTYTIRNCNYLVQEEKADKATEAIIEFCNMYKENK